MSDEKKLNENDCTIGLSAEGTHAIITIGEQLPWKGIWMTIDKVHKDRLELVPVGLTWKRAKQLKETHDA